MARTGGMASAYFSMALVALLNRVFLALSEPMAPLSRHATHLFHGIGAWLLPFAIATASFNAGVAVPHQGDAALCRPPAFDDRGSAAPSAGELRILVLSAQRHAFVLARRQAA